MEALQIGATTEKFCPSNNNAAQTKNLPHGILYAGKYLSIKPLGSGTYGEVFMVQDVTTGKNYALKKMRLEASTSKFGLCPHTIREVVILSKMKCRNVVQLKEIAFDEGDSILLIFELMRRDLRQFIQAKQTTPDTGLPLYLVRRLAFQILIGVRHCHSQGVVHRDLKPQNILVDAEGELAKVADWGLARKISRFCIGKGQRLLTREIVTLWYRPPEILLGALRYGPEVDVWSLGVIIYQMITGVPLVHGPHSICTLLEIFQMFGTPFEDEFLSKLPYFSMNFPRWECRDMSEVFKTKISTSCVDEVSEDLIHLLTEMLQLNPFNRISVKNCIWHPFFKEERENYIKEHMKKYYPF